MVYGTKNRLFLAVTLKETLSFAESLSDIAVAIISSCKCVDQRFCRGKEGFGYGRKLRQFL